MKTKTSTNTPDIAIIPTPQSLTRHAGHFILTSATPLVADAATSAAAAALADALRPAMGRQPAITAAAPANRRAIRFRLDASLVNCGAEGYHLEVSPKHILLAAPAQAGLFYAVQTMRQLLPPQIFSRAPVEIKEWPVPCVTIDDQPRFAWRGLMLDTGHDFQRLSYIFRFIDLMALHKFNIFHWHISDLGTFPLQIDGYPELQNPATLGKRLMGNPPRPVKPGFYTQDEARAVVAYAAARHITVMPEIDLPGHSQPVLIAYPEFDCPAPMYKWQDFERWEYCLASDKARAFLEAALTQVMAIFPSTFIHIGGDECSADHWNKCPQCQAKVKELGLRDVEELRRHFLCAIESFLNAHGRRMIGWDEVFQNGVRPSTAVMAWRPDQKLAVPAATAGHDVVMAHHSHLYFDSSEKTTPPAKVYEFEPLPADLPARHARRILGAQAQLWSDNHPTEAEIDRLLYPRACAVAEITWSAPEQRDWPSFSRRLQLHAQRLSHLGIPL